jgi:RNA-binding protein
MSESNPSFSSKQISHLRTLAHALKPVVMIGNNGLTEKVLHEIEIALNAHELIKIKVQGDDRALRTQMLQDICTKSEAVAVHHIGKQLIIYRAAAKPKILFPK